MSRYPPWDGRRVPRPITPSPILSSLYNARDTSFYPAPDPYHHRATTVPGAHRSFSTFDAPSIQHIARPTRYPDGYHPDSGNFNRGQWATVPTQRRDAAALWAAHFTEQVIQMVEYSDRVAQARTFDCNKTLSPSDSKNGLLFTDLPRYSGKILLLPILTSDSFQHIEHRGYSDYLMADMLGVPPQPPSGFGMTNLPDAFSAPYTRNDQQKSQPSSETFSTIPFDGRNMRSATAQQTIPIQYNGKRVLPDTHVD